MTRRELTLVGAMAVGAVAAVALLRGPVDALDEQLTSLHYRLRGDRRADTNVVVVYVDQEAVRSLGWPVRRNFYALMVKALADLRVKAIGIEAVFEDPKLEYPEYDDLLRRIIASAGNVVLTSYFDSLVAPSMSGSSDTLSLPLFDFPAVVLAAPGGVRPHLPIPAIRQAAAGVGHVNIAGNADIDLFVAAGRARIPAFSAEVLRIYMGTPRGGVIADGRNVTYRRDDGSLAFATTENGAVSVNFPGSLRAFTVYPFLEVLRAYDAAKGDRPASVPVASLRGKIVLVGVIAEGRSAFVRTPVDSHYPAIALHAASIDNALRDGFIVRTPYWLTILLCLAAGILSGIAGIALRSPLNRVVFAGVPLLSLALSFVLFAARGIAVPVMGVVVTGVITGVAGLVYRQRRSKERVDTLESEKSAILEQLRDREAKVALLQRELVSLGAARSKDRTEELLLELRKYKSEIRSLMSQADDMDAYEPGQNEPGEGSMDFEGIIYAAGGPMRPVVEFVAKIAGSEAPVLILGESGTGKELVARGLHKRSARSAGMFVAVNCGALSESLLESELFGHERGAFTGAVKDRLGRFELARGGTIFLDEIGEVSESFQLKLLRVVQEGEFERVGGTTTIKTDVRIVAATNKDLKDLVKQKKFREDLFYRLNVLTVSLPPLRERQRDIALLVHHFLRREGTELRLSKNVMDALQSFHWPGNIRELESAMRRGVLLARADRRTMITMKDLSEEIAAAGRGTVPVEEQVLESLRGKGFSRSSVTETADELGGLNRGTVAEYLRGECLKAFAENTFDMERAVRGISLSTDAAVNDRVRKKFSDYLANIAEAIILSQPWEVSRNALRPKAKNLPQKYHLALEQVGEAYYRGLWRLPQ